MAKAGVYLKDKNGFVFQTKFPQYHEDCERMTAKDGEAAVLEQTKAELRKVYPVGALVQTQCLHVSASGMTRRISVLACVDGQVRRMDEQIGLVIGSRISDSGGLIIGGCGMDMGFSIAYSLGRALYPQGFGTMPRDTATLKILKKARPATRKQAANMVAKGVAFSGRNGDSSGWDNDGGYALNHQWI